VGDVTELLLASQSGSQDAMDRLVPLVYDELKVLAAAYLRSERPDHSLQTTGLVHEAYMKLVNAQRTTWESRAHFFGVAAQAMRRILVDHARRRRARGGGGHVSLDDHVPGSAAADDDDVLAVDEALERLALLDARQARIVELRYFAGLTIEQTAETVGISPATVKREWTSAKAWLMRELGQT
jgi:RNA polymerase sigma factor (TIGR02999 family)